MKHLHEIGRVFKYGQLKMVARECEAIDYEGESFRKTCKGCYFAAIKSFWCSGHECREYVCRIGGSEAGKCAPEYRNDGKFIHYKIRKN